MGAAPAPSQEFAPFTTQLKRQDFPGVQYWDKGDWTRTFNEAAGNTNPNQEGKLDTIGFCEDEEGVPISSPVLSAVRAMARSIFGLLDMDDSNPSPETWAGNANVAHRRLYYGEMYAHFPWLKCCQLDWKVEAIAIEIYPHWRQVHHPHANKGKKRPALAEHGANTRTGESTPSADVPGTQPKRPRRIGEPLPVQTLLYLFLFLPSCRSY